MAVVVLLLLAAVVVALLVLVSRRRAAPPPIEVDDAVAELAREVREWAARRAEEEVDHDAPPGGPAAGSPALPVPPLAPSAADEANHGRPSRSLADLLDPVTFPDDLLPLTHGMSPADLAFRLVLSSTQAPAAVRTWLDRELTAAGFAVSWQDEMVGVARSDGGAMTVRLHPPVDPATVRTEEPEGRRRRKRAEVVKRPDFASAPFEATVVELTLTS